MKFNWNLIRGKAHLQLQIIITKATVCRLYSKYYLKMDGHIQKVKDIEQSHELYQQVTLLQQNITETGNQI